MSKYKGLLEDIKEKQAGGLPADETPPPPPLPRRRRPQNRSKKQPRGESRAVPRAARAATRNSSRSRLTWKKPCISRSRKPCST